MYLDVFWYNVTGAIENWRTPLNHWFPIHWSLSNPEPPKGPSTYIHIYIYIEIIYIV